MASLLIGTLDQQERYFPLESHRLVMIGRDDECTFQVLDDQLSRRHLQIRFEPDETKHYAADYRSANGVFVNGDRIVEDKALADGDAIKIGNTNIVYLSDDHGSAQEARESLRKKGEWKRSTLLND